MKNLKYWMKPIPYLILIAFMLLGAYTEEIYTTKSRQIANLYKEIDNLKQEIDDTKIAFNYFGNQQVFSKAPELLFPLELTEYSGISSYFGQRNDPLRRNSGGNNNPFHNGVDITGIPGARVNAVASGIVIHKYYEKGLHYVNSKWREYEGHKYFNGYVEILHDDGTIGKYGHVAEILVYEGNRVIAGQQIAQISEQVDSFSTGPHLDFRLQKSNGEYMNPLLWIGIK